MMGLVVVVVVAMLALTLTMLIARARGLMIVSLMKHMLRSQREPSRRAHAPHKQLSKRRGNNTCRTTAPARTRANGVIKAKEAP